MAKQPKPLPLRILHGLEDALLVVAFLAMILMSTAQVVLRNGFGIALNWGDTFLSFIVLWVTMIGAMVATREDRQITVDIISHIFPARAQAAIRIFTDLFATILCGVLAYASVQFLIQEKQGAAIAFGSIPTWVAEAILPFGFGVIALRYAWMTGLHAYQAITGKLPPPEEDEEAAS